MGKRTFYAKYCVGRSLLVLNKSRTSPVYSLILGVKIMIVLSSDVAVKDLMDKRSNIYSDRPDMYMMKIISGGNRFLNMVRSQSNLSLMTMPFACTLY